MTQFADTFESGGLSNWPTINGNATVLTAAAFTGNYGARFSPTSGTASQVATSTSKWTQGTFTYAFVRMQLRMNALPVGATADLITLQDQLQVDNFDFFYNNTTGTFWFDLKGATAFTDTGITPRVGHWYDVQAIVFYGATTYTAQVQIDGVQLPLLSSPGETSSFVRTLFIGTSSTAKTYEFDVDNVVVNVGTVQPAFEVFKTMAKQSGLGDNYYVGGVDLSGDTNSLGKIGGGPALLDVTAINESAHERLGGLRDGGIDWVSYFNPTGAHPVLSALPTSDVVCTYCRGTLTGNPAACLVAKQINYDPTRAADGMLTAAVQTQANGFGLEWGLQLTDGLRTDTAATNGVAADFAQANSFGFQAYLQVTAFTGTDVTVKLQDSADNLTFADLASGAFTQVTSAPGAQRIAVGGTATVRRYVRAVTTTTGGFTSATFNVVMISNTVAVTF